MNLLRLALLLCCLSCSGQPIPTIKLPKLARVIVKPPNTNLFSLSYGIDRFDPTSTNVTVWVSNNSGAVTFTNVGLSTNFIIHGFSPTNRYRLWASEQNSNGINSDPSNVLPWRPPLNWFLTLSTIPASAATVCLTNPVGFEWFRLHSAGTNGWFEIAPSVLGDFTQFRGPFGVLTNQAYRLKVTLTNDLATVLASEIKN